MNFGAIPSPPVGVTAGSECSAESSYASVYPSSDFCYLPPPPTPRTSPTPSNKHTMYEFMFADGNVLVSSGMMTRLCQEGHIFKMLLFGGNGFSKLKTTPGMSIPILQYYGITKESFQAIVFSLRTNNAKIAYQYKLLYESIGGFKTIDKHHMNRMKKKKKKKKETSCANAYTTPPPRTTYRTTINLISDDEDDDVD